MIKHRSANRRYLALWFPLLSADRLTQSGNAPAETPFAFIEKRRGALRIVALDGRARTLGLTPGLPLADARALVPVLKAIDHDLLADRLWLERIADICDLYTPMVSLDLADGITLDISGCTHLFGGESRMAADIQARFARLHLRHACADSPEAAQALARFQIMPATDEMAALRLLPIAALRLTPEAEIALRRAGLKTIGALADRPTAPLSARFGEQAIAALDRLLGRSDSRIDPRRAPPALFFDRRFAEPVAHIDQVLAVIAELAADATTALEERHCGGRRFAARFYRSDGAIRDLIVETGLPTRDPKALMRLFAERISSVADPLDPGFGFDMIRLAIPRIEPLDCVQLRLEGGALNEDAMSALIDRLSTRLGRGRLRRLAACDTHTPEQGVLALPAIESRGVRAWPQPLSGEPPLRPLHLFDPPQPIAVMAQVPDGPPRRFRWRRDFHDVTRYEGPERIAAPWWQGEAGLTRDYYRIEDVRGRRFWVFRHGLYGTEKNDPGWYVHGLFA